MSHFFVAFKINMIIFDECFRSEITTNPLIGIAGHQDTGIEPINLHTSLCFGVFF
jgi:hypothetical protein